MHLTLCFLVLRGFCHAHPGFERSLGIAANILAARLDNFIRAEIMERRRQEDRPGQPEYLLTDKGRDLAAVIIALTAWGDTWAAPEGPPVIFRHRDCGGEVTQLLHCRSCSGHVMPALAAARPGPGSKAA